MIITEEVMANAAANMNEAMLRSLPEPRECHHEFSAGFKRKMKRVFHVAEHPIQYHTMQRVASFVLVLFIGFMTILTLSPTVRATVFDWIREKYESFITYYFDNGASTSCTPTRYHISGLPSDYIELTATYDEELGVFTGIYSSSNENILYFTYSIIPENADFFISTEGYEIKQVLVSGIPADLYLSKNGTESNGIIWCDENKNVVFFISAMLDKDSLLALAESVVPIE